MNQENAKIKTISKKVIITVALSFVILFSSYHLNKPVASLATVYFTDKGYVPKELVVEPGTLVAFTNLTESDFWPASSYHPAHSIYPEFDAKQSIGAGETWTFKFNKEGSWEFHDHLQPSSRGNILVRNSSKINVTEVSFNECLQGSVQSDYCVRKHMESLVADGNLEEGFKFLQEVSVKYPGSCHINAHIIGESAYSLFMSESEMVLPDDVSMCANGFWHGVTTKYAQHNGQNISAMSNFCNTTVALYDTDLSLAQEGCYHGIGIGSATVDIGAATDTLALEKLKSALPVCEEVTDVQEMLIECWSGAYHAFSDFMRDKLTESPEESFDPVTFCASEKKDYQFACIINIGSGLSSFSNKSYQEIIPTLSVFDNYLAEAYLRKVSYAEIQNVVRDSEHMTYHANNCMELPSVYRNECIVGAARGLLQVSGNENLLDDSFMFCNLNVFNDSDRKNCYEGIFSYRIFTVDQDKKQEICSVAPKPYKPAACSELER